MIRPATIVWSVLAFFACYLVVDVPDWHSPVRGTQMHFRGLGAAQFAPTEARLWVSATLPKPEPAVQPEGRPASAVYKNVQVLGQVDAAEFMRLQRAITTWVAPTQGCAFCHDGQDYASDAKPTKIAARDMLKMVRYVNSAWASHVGPSGVTCFTCHRGQPVPSEALFLRKSMPEPRVIGHRDEAWYEPAETVYNFFPAAGYAEYYLGKEPISAQSPVARGGQVAQQVVVKRIYEMMMQMSLEIGVNCGFCHNSRALMSWAESTPERWVGFYALRLIRDLNRTYLLPLASKIPQQRERVHENRIPALPDWEAGIQPGNALATCGTCHYGLPKPLNGKALLAYYPELKGDAPPAPESNAEALAGFYAHLNDIKRPTVPGFEPAKEAQ